MHELLRSKLSLLEKVTVNIPELIYIGENKILRTPTEIVEIDTGIQIATNLQDILKRFRSTTGFGRGLAASQIGINASVFVTFLDDEFQTYINPNIIWESPEKILLRELCLSSGIVWPDVARSKEIEMSWVDIKGKNVSKKVDGILARLFSHEYDHTIGIVNIDRAEKSSIELALTNPIDEKFREIL